MLKLKLFRSASANFFTIRSAALGRSNNEQTCYHCCLECDKDWTHPKPTGLCAQPYYWPCTIDRMMARTSAEPLPSDSVLYHESRRFGL